MISPLSSYDDELLNSAYANISLIADEAWSFDHEDPFRKLNHSLWIQSCEVTAKYKENGGYRPRLVRDVISESRLAKYGNYEYDEQRERMYKPDNDKLSDELGHFHPTEVTEPWMFPEVQEHFARLILSNSTQAYQEPSAPGLKCNTAKKDDEIICSNFQSDWNESSKKRRQKINPKESRKVVSHGESFSTHKLNEEPHEKSSKKFSHRRYIVETTAEMQLQSRIESEAVRNIWDLEKFQQRYQQCYRTQQSRVVRQMPDAQPTAQYYQQFYCTLQYQPLILKTEYERQPTLQPPPVLSAEVPEFFPKFNLPGTITCLNSTKEYNKTCQIRYFPSLNNRAYQSELFPYRLQQEAATVFSNAKMSMLPIETSIPLRSSQEWIQRIAPPNMQIQLASSSSFQPICTSLQPIRDTVIAHPLQMYEKFLPCIQPNPTTIPVYQRPMELYPEQTSKRRNHGVDFNNLILLTKNSIRTRRGNSTAPQKSLLLDSKQSLRADQNMMQWYDKNCGVRRTKKVVTVNALVSELRDFEEKYDYNRAGTNWRTAKSPTCCKSSEHMRSKDEIFGNEYSRCGTLDNEERNKRTNRPLYRDVLANASGGHRMILENIFERRFDELEQQAMEQYRNSEESLALKYQELERQAIEQYRNNNATDEKQIDQRLIPPEDQDCLDGQGCSKYGQCSPSRGDREKKDFCFLQPQIALLKPKGRSLPNVLHGSRNISNQQTTITSKSLSTLTDRLPKKSKNMSKGASGDKTDMNVPKSKQRLILVSPFERKSEARLMKTTDLQEICSISQAGQDVLSYYRSSEIARNGSGDENIAIIQSPSAEVWLSGF